ncbi:MAG: carboxypeptidase-like regulatory domain-containing protein [Candidatus Acidiferrales bacterium]
MNLQSIRALGLGLLLSICALPLAAAPNAGKLSGVVIDAAGTPQLGATVLVSSEDLRSASLVELLTNDRGRFAAETLPAGSYSIKVTLAGFLPAIEQHIQISSQHTTLLEIVMGSVFSSLEKLRRAPDQPLPSDEWIWVLRSSSATRPVLRWQDGEIVIEPGAPPQMEIAQRRGNHGRFDLVTGADHPGSISNLADSPGTAFAYDMGLGSHGQLLLAGQFSYEGASPSGGFVTEWLPSGEMGAGSVTSIIVRESRLGPGGPTFRGLRASHENQFTVGDRVSIRYGSDYVMAGLVGTTMAVRPRGEIAVQLSRSWQASALVAASPWQNSDGASSAIQSAMNSLDDFPTLMMRDGRPVLENGMHEEIAIEHALSKDASITAAVFHDRSTHTAVFGRGAVSSSDYLQDYFSDVFAYDAGNSASLGARAAYQQKLGDNLSTALVYSYAGALAPNEDAIEAALRTQLATRYRHSLAARVSTTIPKSGTKVSASYKWISGPVVSHQDAFGESLYHLDPFMSMEIRQSLPSFFPGHMQALADFGNLFAQGYVPITTGDGRVMLVPSYRYFRGGLSIQF